MNDRKQSRRATFEALHAKDADPWAFETSQYERAKRAKVLANIEGRRFAKALEVGCSNGVLTRDLAPYCDRLQAIDVANSALALAEQRLRGIGNVELLRCEIPIEWPEGSFDLIVLSEILYFLSADEIAATAGHVWRSLAPAGLCVLVNWTGPNDLAVDGQEAVEIFRHARPWKVGLRSCQPKYRIDHLEPSERGRLKD